MAKDILIDVGPLEKRSAVLLNGVLDNYFVEREKQKRNVGNIFRGKVKSILPGMQAAFVDIGLERNGFLSLAEMTDDELQYQLKIQKRGPFNFLKKLKKGKSEKPQLKVGDDVVVQVVKEPIGTKGARLTTHLSIPGRLLVMMPLDSRIGISRKVEDPERRKNLREFFKSANVPSGFGFIVRTVAEETTEMDLKREVKYLAKIWKDLEGNIKKSSGPLVYQEPGLLVRLMRDHIGNDVSKIIINSKPEYKNLLSYINWLVPEYKSHLKLYNGVTPLFEKHGIKSEVDELYNRKIYLKSGASIVIEQTESLVAIDINTERFKGAGNLQETVFATNKEAAKMIARQIKLRDLGGIIIIDFIDMEKREYRNEVYRILKDSFRADKAKTKILPFSSIGVLQMTRQRLRKDIESVSYESCKHCGGRGLVKSYATISIEIMRKLENFLKLNRRKKITLSVNPEIAERLQKEDKNSIKFIEKMCRTKIQIKPNIEFKIDEARVNTA